MYKLAMMGDTGDPMAAPLFCLYIWFLYTKYELYDFNGVWHGDAREQGSHIIGVSHVIAVVRQAVTQPRRSGQLPVAA